MVLDANDPNQVVGARVIEADLGEANRKMMIFGGTACPNWSINDDDHVYRGNVTVNLRRTVLAVEQATVTTGLASIGNDDTTFLFAIDSSVIDVEPTTQELLLNCDVALQGEHTGLNRFGYSVVAIVTTQVTGISGTIRWAKNIFDASHLNAGQVAQLFQITANHVDRINPPGGFGYDKYTPLAFGVTTGLSSDNNDFIVPYEIPGAPYNQPLVVRVDIGNLFIATQGGPSAGQTGGPNPVILTVAQPGVTGVDFRIGVTIVR